MTLAAFARPQRSSTGELVEHLEDATAAGNLALPEAVRHEFRGRPERERQGLLHRYGERTPGSTRRGRRRRARRSPRSGR
jgi:hypothetical protein